MNFFELYELPLTFHPDAALVKSKFYELSRRYHPDRFARAGHAEKMEALTMAALNNDAHKTLAQPDAVMQYVLKLAGVLDDEEKYNLPPTFLMEMMDLNDAVTEYTENPADTALRQQSVGALNEQLAAWQQEAGRLTAQYDAGDHNPDLLARIKDMYFRKKYLLRIQERMNTFAAL